VTFVVAVFVLGLLSGALITDHAWKASTHYAQEEHTP
jgi:hypothetical protein